MAKTTAAKGVPKRAENPALIPHMVIILWSFSSSFILLPRKEAMLPPICKAAPSRPDEPPKRWVINVLINISGAVLILSWSFVLTASRT